MEEKAKEFARLVSAGFSRAEAYKKAFNRPELDNVAASKLASKLAKKGEVREKMAKIEAAMDKRAVCDRQRRMEMLSARAETHFEEGNTFGMVKCIAELNKMDGAYEPARVEVQGDIVKDFVRAQIERASREPLVHGAG